MFQAEDRQALARAVEVRRVAKAFVERLQAALPELLVPLGEHRVSRAREDSDRVGLYVFIGALGNVWCGVPLEGEDMLRFRFEVKAEHVAKGHLALLSAGLRLDPPNYVATLDLDAADSEHKARQALVRWLQLSLTAAA
jgi:hypothetical protein